MRALLEIRKNRKGGGIVTKASPVRLAVAEHLPAFLEARQHYLDALPIAAAVAGSGPHGFFIECRNELFKRYERPFSPDGGDQSAILDRGGLGQRIHDFLDSDRTKSEFDWRDGDAIAGRHFAVKLARLAPTDAAGQRCLVSLLDRTVEVQTERNLRREMLSDSLTGLPNRAAFTELVEAETARTNARVAVLVVDLVRFSRINECIGTMAGDELLITVARRLMHALRAGDSLARIGGDEFALLVRLGEGPGDALNVASRVQDVLAAPFRLSDLEITVDCSIGCAVTSGRSGEAEKLVRHAQFALKRAKETGQTEIYQPTALNLARQRFSLETELRRAVEAQQLTLAFQPLIDLGSDRVSGFEALARWEHADHGVIPPTDFIPVAEESGLIVPLGRWALDAAARALADWDARAGTTLDVSVSVNLSAIQLARDDVPGAVAFALASAGVAGNRMTLELTESAVIADPERATRVLDGLKALDTTLAMDDFGTGYSCLAYLQRLPIDILKIDRSFVTDMLSDKNKIAIVRAVLSLADALGMSTTAEGIESYELSRTLAALGCATGQGYFYSDALEADAAYAYLVARNA